MHHASELRLSGANLMGRSTGGIDTDLGTPTVPTVPTAFTNLNSVGAGGDSYPALVPWVRSLRGLFCVCFLKGEHQHRRWSTFPGFKRILERLLLHLQGDSHSLRIPADV